MVVFFYFGCNYLVFNLSITFYALVSHGHAYTYTRSRLLCVQNVAMPTIIPYPRERGPMGSAPYTGPKLGDGPIFD